MCSHRMPIRSLDINVGCSEITDVGQKLIKTRFWAKSHELAQGFAQIAGVGTGIFGQVDKSRLRKVPPIES